MFSYTLYNHCMIKDNIYKWDPMVKKGGVTVFVSTVCISVPNFVKFGQPSQKLKNVFVLEQKYIFQKLQYLKNSCTKIYRNKLWQWSIVRDNFWLSLKVCICCGFCNDLWQRFFNFWDNFPHLKRVIKKLLLMKHILLYNVHLPKLPFDVIFHFLSLTVTEIEFLIFDLQTVLWLWAKDLCHISLAYHILLP